MNNSPFIRHGIERLSPSSINTWIDSPGLWALRYLGGVKEETGAAMARGKAVEDGILHVLHGREGPEEIALASFLTNLQGEIVEDEQNLIPGMIEQCQLWKPPGKINASQLKVEHWFDGLSVPVIGYLDFAFDDIDVDLKTTKQCPSKPRPDHARQIALYRAARKQRGALLYVTAKKHAYYELDDAAMEVALAELQSAAVSLERFLSRFDDAEDAIRCLPINRDSYRFSQAHEAKLNELHI